MDHTAGTAKEIDAWVRNHFDHRDSEILHDPYPVYQLMRDACPVARSDAYEDGFWAVSRYEDVKAILSDAARFDAGRPSLAIPALSRKLYPAEVNGERHVVLRRILASVLDQATVLTMEDRIREQIRRILDRVAARGECDVIADLSVQIPTFALFHPPWLGHPLPQLGEDWPEKIRDWVLEFKFIPEKSQAAGDRIAGYLSDLLDDRRENPQDDVATKLNAALDAGEITREEADALLFSIVFGGIDTPASVIGFTMMHLAQNPDLRESLRADPDMIPPAIDEILRFYGPTQGLRRTATEDVCIAGQQIAKGDRVLVMLNSASRDERVFEEADRFVADRRPNVHMGFGWGMHRCVGSNAGRLMIRVLIEEVVARAGDFRIRDGVKLQFLQSTGRTLRSLPVVFGN